MATYSIQQIFLAARAAGFTPHQAPRGRRSPWPSPRKTSALNDHGEHSMRLWQINVAAGVRSNDWVT